MWTADLVSAVRKHLNALRMEYGDGCVAACPAGVVETAAAVEWELWRAEASKSQARDPAPIRRILVAVDFDEPSRWATDWAVRLAGPSGAKVSLLHVLAPRTAPVIPPAIAGERWTAHTPSELPAELLHNVGKAVPPALFAGETILEGDPAREILLAANMSAADILVLGTHVRSRIGRLLLGSVAEAVIHRSPVPVLVVGGPCAAPQPAADVGNVAAGASSSRPDTSTSA